MRGIWEIRSERSKGICVSDEVERSWSAGALMHSDGVREERLMFMEQMTNAMMNINRLVYINRRMAKQLIQPQPHEYPAAAPNTRNSAIPSSQVPKMLSSYHSCCLGGT